MSSWGVWWANCKVKKKRREKNEEIHQKFKCSGYSSKETM
jgi:hypothetical protein